MIYLLETCVVLLYACLLLGAVALLAMAAVLACVWGRLMVSRQRPQPVKLLSHGESVALAAPHRWAHIADPWHGFQDYQKPTAEAGSAENIESGTSMSLARKKHPLRDPAKASGLPPLGPSTPRG